MNLQVVYRVVKNVFLNVISCDHNMKEDAFFDNPASTNILKTIQQQINNNKYLM